VEGGVEAGHLREVGIAGAQGADGGQGVGLVQRRERDERLEGRHHGLVQADRAREGAPAVHHPVPHARQLVPVELLAEEGEEVV